MVLRVCPHLKKKNEAVGTKEKLYIHTYMHAWYIIGDFDINTHTYDPLVILWQGGHDSCLYLHLEIDYFEQLTATFELNY